MSHNFAAHAPIIMHVPGVYNNLLGVTFLYCTGRPEKSIAPTVAVATNFAFRAAGVRDGSRWRSIAATPDTMGVAKLVPLRYLEQLLHV